MTPHEKVSGDHPDIVEQLRRFPNPNAIWSAFRADLITEKTVFALLPDDRPSKLQLALETIAEIFSGKYARFFAD
jgi:hypothetical protein